MSVILTMEDAIKLVLTLLVAMSAHVTLDIH